MVITDQLRKTANIHSTL